MRLIDADALPYENQVLSTDEEWCLKVADIDAAPTIEQPRWIPVTERLPKSRMAVLGVLWRNTVDIVWYDKDDGVWQNEWVNAYNDGEVTHWMPLPTPPKENET